MVCAIGAGWIGVHCWVHVQCSTLDHIISNLAWVALGHKLHNRRFDPQPCVILFEVLRDCTAQLLRWQTIGHRRRRGREVVFQMGRALLGCTGDL